LIILKIATSARWNSALPDDGDYNEICWSCFNVNFNVHFKIFLRQFICASVGKQINFDSIKMHCTPVKTIPKYTNSGKINVEKLCTGTMTSPECFKIWATPEDVQLKYLQTTNV